MNNRDKPASYRPVSRRRVLGWSGVVLAAPLLAACHTPVPPMRVGSIVFPGYETLFLAREVGLLDERRVRLVEMLANTDTLRALAVEQLDAAAMTLDELMTARADGIDLRAVLVFDESDGADVVLGKPHVSLQRLQGKHVAVEDGAVGAVMLSALLKATGLKATDIVKVPMTLDRSEELYANPRVDAVVTSEPWASRLEKKGAVRVFDSRAIPGRIVDVLAVRAAALHEYGPSLRYLLTSYFAAQKVMRDAPQRAGELMAPRLQTRPGEVMDLYRGLYLPDLADNRQMLARGGAVDATSRELQKVMVEAGLLPASSVLHEMSDPRFLPL